MLPVSATLWWIHVRGGSGYIHLPLVFGCKEVVVLVDPFTPSCLHARRGGGWVMHGDMFGIVAEVVGG
jgi:hypothetical protein